MYAAIGALRGSWSTADVWIRPAGGQEQKITAKVRRLEVAGLVKRGPVGARYHERRHYWLTDDGVRVLAAHDAKTAPTTR